MNGRANHKLVKLYIIKANVFLLQQAVHIHDVISATGCKEADVRLKHLVKLVDGYAVLAQKQCIEFLMKL
jgi:hypothetical protein